MPNKELSDETVAFGARVRELRGEQGLSQAAVGERSGLHRTYIGGVERGERNVSLQAIFAIAQALDVNPADFFPRSGAS